MKIYTNSPQPVPKVALTCPVVSILHRTSTYTKCPVSTMCPSKTNIMKKLQTYLGMSNMCAESVVFYSSPTR